MMEWAAFLPIIALLLGFSVYCLLDLRKSEVKHLPKWGWALVILLVSSPVGGVIYLAVGRQQR